MAIGTPLDLGHFASQSTPTSGSITTLNTVSTGDVVCLIRYTNATTGTFTSAPTDTAGNTYVQAKAPPGVLNVTPVLDIWYSTNSITEASSSTISFNFSGSSLRQGVSAFTVSGIRTTNALATDVFTLAQGTTGTSTSATSQNARSDWDNVLLIGGFTTGTNVTALTATGWTAVGGVLNGGANVQPFYKIQSSQTVPSLVAFAPTWTTSAQYRCQVWGFIGIGAKYLAESTGLLTMGVAS